MINDTIESTARALTRAALDAHTATAQHARDSARTQPCIDRRIGPPTRRTGKNDRRITSLARSDDPYLKVNT